jgi:hypothetical protein
LPRAALSVKGVALKQGEAATMRGQRSWVIQGIVQPLPSITADDLTKEDQRYQAGEVRLTSGDLGTEVKWVVNSPCVSSLFKALQCLPSLQAPFILRFFAVGWFEEVYRDARSAAQRIEQVLTRGDRHFTSRVFIADAATTSLAVPPVLKDALTGHSISRDYSVDCVLDENSGAFHVERVGSQSAIGRVWGTYTSSYPCQSGGSYGDPVNATYVDVLRHNRPRYDHVLAALRLPDNRLHWIPYHRVVMPQKNVANRMSVTVVSQIARVEIKVL